MTTASTSTIVQTVSRCIVARSWAIGTASTVCASPRANTRRASRSAPPGVVRSPMPTATTPGASSRTSPPSRCSQLRAVEQLDAGEARVVGVDGAGEGALAVPGRHRQARHRDLVADPDRGVAGEQQVGQRVDDEVARGPSPRSQPVPAASSSWVSPAISAPASSSAARSLRCADAVALQGRAQPGVVDGRGDQVGPGGRSTAPRRAGRSRCRTSTPRSRSASANPSCSSCARSTHGTPSKSSWSLLRGVSRRARRPGGAASPCAAGRPRWWRPWPAGGRLGRGGVGLAAGFHSGPRPGKVRPGGDPRVGAASTGGEGLVTGGIATTR